jgi:hypothetical protein
LRLLTLLITIFFLLAGRFAFAQQPPQPGTPITLQNAPQRDTTNRKSSTNWHDEPVTIYSTAAFSGIKSYLPDTQVHHFHRRPFIQTWNRDLGNLGTPLRSQLFTPENLGHTGPSLGYHGYDVYRFHVDSLRYYNTTRPYTSFAYQLGSKLEQTLRIMHTQNISPRWNFAARYQKINSAGYYRLQRSNHDAGALNTHYASKNQRYELFGAAVYNKEQTDENGGIVADTLLNDARYGDRQTIPVALDNPSYIQRSDQGRRSSFTNTLRDFNVLLRHQYTLGHLDTLYNADSTQYSIQLVHRFSVGHRFEAGSQKHKFKSLVPDPAAWSSFFTRTFATSDSVYTEQYWSWVDNRFVLSGFVGKGAKQVSGSAGIGNRVDAFYTEYAAGRETSSTISTYLTGDVQKEATTPGAWAYNASAKFFITGASAGDFILSGALSKDFGPKLAMVTVGGSQQLTSAPYAYTIYENQYFRQSADLSKESITTFYGLLHSLRLGLSAGVRSYLIGNYIYLADSAERVSNGKMQLSQAGAAFSLTQFTLRKLQRLGNFVFDADVALQAIAGDAPVNVPLALARATISYESPLFHGALKAATGVDLRYHSPYKAEGYAPFYNRFYFQNAYTADNMPEAALFFNFKVKRFRAYLMADQFQTLFWRNTIVYPGYPSQDLMIRFGFEWVMVN